MSTESNKALARRYFEVLPNRPEGCGEIFAPKIRFHTLQRAEGTPQDAESDPRSEEATCRNLRATWGDYTMTVNEIIAEADRVVATWTFRGVQQGEYSGL